jgi:hypothetical protein
MYLTVVSGMLFRPVFEWVNENRPFAMNSQLTRAHWDARLSWLFHKPVGDVDGLGAFADGILARSSAVEH